MSNLSKVVKPKESYQRRFRTDKNYDNFKKKLEKTIVKLSTPRICKIILLLFSE